MLEKLNGQLAEAGRKPVVEKDPNKSPPEEEEKEQPSWATPELDNLGTAVAEKLEKANEARDSLDAALGVAPGSSSGDELVAEGGSGSASASGPSEPVASSGASGPSDASGPGGEKGNETAALSPFEVLKKRMAGIAKMAREMLGGPKKNITTPSGASGSAEEDDEDASGAAAGESGASGPEMKSLTRTFVSDGATSTVTTVFNNKKGDSAGKVWSDVKKMEKEHGEMKNAAAAAAASASGPAVDGGSSGPAAEATGAQGESGASGAKGKSGASGAKGKSGASGSETPVDKKLKALEEELYGKSGSSGASGSESGPEESGGSGASGAATGGAPINGVTDSTILRLIASRMDGMGTPKGGSGASGASGSSEPQTPGDEQPFEDSKAIEKIAKQISKVDKKDSKALIAIARKLATADSTTGLEKDGKDESEDAKALRGIAKSLLKLTGLLRRVQWCLW